MILCSAFLVGACAPPRAVLVEEVVSPVQVSETPPAAVQVQTVEPNDGLRLPDYADMPGETELKRGPSERPPTEVPAPVISRPPLEPPSRSTVPAKPN